MRNTYEINNSTEINYKVNYDTVKMSLNTDGMSIEIPKGFEVLAKDRGKFALIVSLN